MPNIQMQITVYTNNSIIADDTGDKYKLKSSYTSNNLKVDKDILYIDQAIV